MAQGSLKLKKGKDKKAREKKGITKKGGKIVFEFIKLGTYSFLARKIAPKQPALVKKRALDKVRITLFEETW